MGLGSNPANLGVWELLISGAWPLLGKVVPLSHDDDCVWRVSGYMNLRFGLWQVLIMSLRGFQMWIQGMSCGWKANVYTLPTLAATTKWFQTKNDFNLMEVCHSLKIKNCPLYQDNSFITLPFCPTPTWPFWSLLLVLFYFYVCPLCMQWWQRSGDDISSLETEVKGSQEQPDCGCWKANMGP